jgi:hypothetical protein
MPDTPQTALTWTSILTLAFSTGAVTAVFNQGFAWKKGTLSADRTTNELEGRSRSLRSVTGGSMSTIMIMIMGTAAGTRRCLHLQITQRDLGRCFLPN